MAWLDLSESVEELFAEFQDNRDYEQFIVLSDIATCRGVASAERSKEWREEKRRDAGWVARERQRQRARRLRPADIINSKIVSLRDACHFKLKVRRLSRYMRERQLTFSWAQPSIPQPRQNKPDHLPVDNSIQLCLW